MNNKANFIICISIGLVYFLTSLPLLDKYGITHDEPGIYNSGELFLEYLITGDKKFLDSDNDSQKKLSLLNIPKHPWHKNGAYGRTNHPQIIPLLSAISCKIFFQKLNWLGPIEAHHLLLLGISSIGLSALAIFIYYETSNLFFALMSALFLGLFPRFFAMSHNNPVDAASAVMIMLGAFSFYIGFKSRNGFLILLASFFLGINFAVKTNAVITVATTLSWLLFQRKAKFWSRDWKKNDIFILPFYFLVAFVIFLIGHPLYWDITGPGEIITKSVRLIEYESIKGIGRNPHWNFSQPYMFFSVTPSLMIFTFPFGLFYLFKNHRSLFTLILLLLFWSIFRTCLPYAKNFDGIRHYIEAAVPLSILSAAGLFFIVHCFWKKILNNLYPQVFFPLIFSAILFYMVSTIYKYFPYEIIYFNNIVGGAGEAFNNPRLIYWHGDYWQTSSREIAEWLNKNGEKNANIYDLLGITRYYHDPVGPPSFLRKDFVFPDNHSCEMKLLSAVSFRGMPMLEAIKHAKKETPHLIKNPDCFIGDGYMVITNLRQAFLWKSLYQTLILNSENIPKVIARDGYIIAFIIKTNVLIIFDKKTREALHFEMGNGKVFLTEK